MDVVGATYEAYETYQEEELVGAKKNMPSSLNYNNNNNNNGLCFYIFMIIRS